MVIGAFLVQADPSMGLVSEVRTAVSEAVTNAVVHGYRDADGEGKIVLRASIDDSRLLRVEVEDFGCGIGDVEQARAYLQANLPKIQAIANQALEAAGCDCEAVVTLCREAFDTRYYDTFTLPAGVYEALRITIGAGEGQNWWCVAFPTLCLSATSEGFEAEAAGAGFPDSLTGALAGEPEYEVRFFLLDALGKLENLFRSGI